MLTKAGDVTRGSPRRDSNSDIWGLVLAGDNAAWDKIVNRYQSLVYSIAIKCGLSLEEAGDCFQHTWLALYNNRKKLKDPNCLPSWLATTARREAYLIRKQTRKYTDDTEVESRPDSSLLPDEELASLERQAVLEGALARLDERCARLISLLFFGGDDLTYEQIATKSQIAFNSLGPIRNRCLKKLKNIFSELGIESVRDFMEQDSNE